MRHTRGPALHAPPASGKHREASVRRLHFLRLLPYNWSMTNEAKLAAAHRAARLAVLSQRAATPAAAEQLMRCARDWAVKSGLSLEQCTACE